MRSVSRQSQAPRHKLKALQPKRTSADESWMRLALKLALKGKGNVSPNPLVGACVVSRGKLVGQGWHAFYGGPHAEVNALRKAGRKARGSVLYITLEPCSSWGKTPPCVDAIIQAGVRRVVFASLDPNPKHAGRALGLLQKAGVAVVSGILAAEARLQNEAFFKWVKTGMPLVTLKMAQTLDGKIATVSGQSKWISSAESREFVQRLRAEHDGLLVGKNTWQADNPRLTVRSLTYAKHRPGYPWRILLDPRAELPIHARIFSGSQSIVCAVGEAFLKKASDKRWPAAVVLLPLKLKQGRVDLSELLRCLGELGIMSVMVEGGGETAWSFLKAQLVDKIVWITAPKFFGGNKAKTSVGGAGVALPAQALRLKSWTSYALGDDLIVEGRF